MDTILNELNDAHKRYIKAIKDKMKIDQEVISARQSYLMKKEEVSRKHEEELIEAENNINL